VSETRGECGGDAGEAVFFFVLTAPSRVHVDSRGSAFDTALYVRTGACNSGREIGCDDDSGGSRASLLDFGILYSGLRIDHNFPSSLAALQPWTRVRSCS
jgi:hypothetical protein